MNKIILCGRLTADAEMKCTNDGKVVSRFNFAVNRRFKRDGDPEADFFQCVAFGKIAETFKKCNVGKGTKLLIEGEMRNNNYERDGVRHYGMQLIVNSFEFCESNGSSGQSAPHMDSRIPMDSKTSLMELMKNFRSCRAIT